MRGSLGLARRLLAEIRRGSKPRRFSPAEPAPTRFSARELALGVVIPKFTPSDMVEAYRKGLIITADHFDDRYLTLADPPTRAILPVSGFRVPTTLARTVRKTPYQVRVSADFPRLLEMCAEPAEDRPTTWMGRTLRQFYCTLFTAGLAQSIEVWEGDVLLGGCLGVTIGAAHFGESMVSRARDVSKIALVHNMARLARAGVQLVDVQYITEHLRRFGAIEVSRAEYQARLRAATGQSCDLASVPAMSGEEALETLRTATAGDTDAPAKAG